MGGSYSANGIGSCKMSGDAGMSLTHKLDRTLVKAKSEIRVWCFPLNIAMMTAMLCFALVSAGMACADNANSRSAALAVSLTNTLTSAPTSTSTPTLTNTPASRPISTSTPVSTNTPTAMPTSVATSGQESSSASTLSPSGKGFTMLSLSYGFTCGLHEDGSAACWGSNHDFHDNWIGQATPPEGERFTYISAGVDYACGLREDGRVVCWGSNNDPRGNWVGQATPPRDDRFTHVATSLHHTCGLREDGFAVCWGDIGHRTEPLSEDEDFTRITPYCGQNRYGVAVCWDDISDEMLSPPETAPPSGQTLTAGHTRMVLPSAVA